VLVRMVDIPRARPVFPAAQRPKSIPDDPEALFGELPRSRDGVGALWSHQADQLRVYSEKHRDTADVALELPTGSGKTLVGLLAGEWRRRALGHRVVYACPTVQLARQVVLAAGRQGIVAHQFTGSNRLWDARALSAYTRADAIAVTVYSHIFNINSHLADAKTLIFDDAHAAEGYVAEAWAVNVKWDEAAYGDLFDALGSDVDPHLVRRMSGDHNDSGAAYEVQLLPVSLVQRRLTDIDQVLASLPNKSDASYRFSMIRPSLASCLFYVSRGGWYIRPMIPPTFQHAAFVDPAQRMYLSATLGEAGELERAFGRYPIERVPVPPNWERAGSGRRFFVFPELATFDPDVDTVEVEPDDPDQLDFDATDVDRQPTLLQRLADLDAKRLVLTPDQASADNIVEELAVPSNEIYTPGDKFGVESFLDAACGTLLAPNRYDGMDLADTGCRFMIMSGVPSASHLQDRFLESKLRAGEVLAERTRTRIVQGAGRCTRGPQDWAVVVVYGQDLLRYFSDRDNTKPMPIELQAEIEFGLRASVLSFTNNVALTSSALEQDQDWRDSGEPALADGRRLAERLLPPIAGELRDSAPREVDAWTAAWRGDWSAAGKAATRVLEGLTSSAARPYRALWAYLGSAWFARAAADGDIAAAARASELLKQAHRAAAGTTWLREVQPLPAGTAIVEPADEGAIDTIIERINGPLKSSVTHSRRMQTMLNGLSNRKATAYEQGLVELGVFLGADSFKPEGQGRTDAAWIWPESWMAVEAKSEQTADRISMEYVRKANTQLGSLAADRGVEEPPEQSATVIVAQNRLIDPDAVPIANPDVCIAETTTVLDIAYDASRAWNDLRGAIIGIAPEAARESVSATLWEHRILPTQVRERLTQRPIRGR
jgi:hypothetical protein